MNLTLVAVKTKTPLLVTAKTKKTLILERQRGVQGLSAYQIAVNNGFIGSESEWLASLKAPSGYLHTQVTPLDTWIINHNLNKYPSVELFSEGLVKFEGDIIHTSVNQAVVSFATAISGLAQCN